MGDDILDVVKGGGEERPVTTEELAEIKSEIAAIVRDFSDGLGAARVDTDNTRFCVWEGQSVTGRKLAENNNDEEPMPFDGACDQRIRLVDKLINEDMMLCVLASMRARVVIKGGEASDTEYAGKMNLVLNWVKRQMGFLYMQELMKLAQYVFGDSPAVGWMKVFWRRKIELEMRTLTIDELMEFYVTSMMQDFDDAEAEEGPEEFEEAVQEAVRDFRAALEDDEFGEESLAEVLVQFFPHLKTGRAKKIIRQLRGKGSARFPAPYVKQNGIEMRAKRFGDEWYVPMNTGDFQDARIVAEPEWLTAAQVKSREVSDGWSKEFIEEVLKHEAERTFTEYVRNDVGVIVERAVEFYKGLYQVVTVYRQRVTDDGVLGRYFVTMHDSAEKTATGWQLLDYKHGKLPGHVMRREVLTSRMLEARGLSELWGPHQDLLKMFVDSFGDNAQLAAVPPIVTRGRRSEGRLYIKPLEELQAKRDGDYSWLDPPQYPQTVDKMLAEVRRQIDEANGRSGPEVSTELVALHDQFKVLWWLVNQREWDRQILQLAQEFLTDEDLQRITNGKGVQVIRTTKEIQGEFDMDLYYDPRDMNPEYVATVGKFLKDIILAMDRDKTVRASPLVAALMWRFAPDLAEASLVEVDEAQLAEIEDEMNNLKTIRTGVEPTRKTDGSENYALRISMYEDIEKLNPDAYSDMSPDKMNILLARMEYLRAQDAQFGENAQTGREGAERALPAEGVEG